MLSRAYLSVMVAAGVILAGCGKQEPVQKGEVAKPADTPQSIAEEYIFTKKAAYIEKCEDDLDALEMKLGEIRNKLEASDVLDPHQVEATIKDLYARLDYADAVLDRLRMSASDGWKKDQQIVIEAIEALDEACTEVVKDLDTPQS